MYIYMYVYMYNYTSHVESFNRKGVEIGCFAHGAYALKPASVVFTCGDSVYRTASLPLH